MCKIYFEDWYYYTKKDYFKTREGLNILNAIDEIYTDFPYYGTRRMKVALKEKDIHIETYPKFCV